MSIVGTTIRSEIRHYLINLLREKIDVGGRVFSNRATSPVFLEELPAVCVTLMDESTEVIAGSQYLVKEYRRDLNVTITVAVEEVRDPDSNINENQKGEDYLDYLALQVERELFYDYRLARRLPGFDPNTNMVGLTHGVRLTGVSTYDVDTEGDRRVIAQDLRFIYPYQSPGYVDLILPEFSEYYAAIIRTGSTEETVDRVLLAAEGTPGE
jgi:hypothetical protein